MPIYYILEWDVGPKSQSWDVLSTWCISFPCQNDLQHFRWNATAKHPHGRKTPPWPDDPRDPRPPICAAVDSLPPVWLNRLVAPFGDPKHLVIKHHFPSTGHVALHTSKFSHTQQWLVHLISHAYSSNCRSNSHPTIYISLCYMMVGFVALDLDWWFNHH